MIANAIVYLSHHALTLCTIIVSDSVFICSAIFNNASAVEFYFCVFRYTIEACAHY
jgi:hypothetical protein